jgi:pimeloyl-ACP methyl ester carboxylesterase
LVIPSLFLLALPLAADTATVQTIAVAPAESIAVTVVGHGEPVVFIPGLFGSAFAFRNIAPRLAEAGFEAVIIEPLGIGGSARPRSADYSLTAQAARVAAVLDTLGLRDAVVVAHSIGGSIAFRLAFHRPDLVAGIVSIEGGPAEEATTSGFRFAMHFAKLLRFGGSRLLRSQVDREMKQASGDSSWVTDAIVTGYTAARARGAAVRRAASDSLPGGPAAGHGAPLERRSAHRSGSAAGLTACAGGRLHRGGRAFRFRGEPRYRRRRGAEAPPLRAVRRASGRRAALIP